MTYIKLLTVLAGLALLTACGGGTAETPANNNGGEMPDNDKTDEMPDNDKTGEVNTTDCTQTPFHDDCLMNNAPALTLRQTMCFASVTANPTCGAVIMDACVANPFRAETACMADTYLPNRIAECITDGNAGEAKCETLLSDTDMNTALTDCLTNPFDVACESVTAFTTYALARTNRASFCDNSDNVADDLCTGDVVMPICGLDPFNAICFTDDTYLSPRITDCIMAGNAGEEKCETLLSDTAMNTELTDCLTNPFATACESVTAFTDFALARTNRLTFCNDNMNVANGLCTGENLMNVCVADPFNAICFTDATYLPARITNCITGGNAGDMKCDTIVSDSTMNDAITNCLENPFATACESVSAFTTFALARTNRVTFCEIGGNESNTLCMDTTLTNLCEFNPFSTACIGHPNTPDLQVASCRDVNNNSKDPSCTEVLLVKENDLPAYPALPATTRRTGFLEGGTLGISITGFTDTTSSGSLNFTATAGSGENAVSLGGAATDGLAWKQIRFVDNTFGFYAGIFSGTNMGAPLVRPATATGAMVEWKGIIQGTDNTRFNAATPFTLNVDLFNRTLKAFLPSPTNNNTAFDINGTYNAKGIISGTTSYAFYTDNTDKNTFDSTSFNSMGLLTGLIGEKGAVAAFRSNTQVSGYSGGFIAVPPPPPPNACIALTTCVDTGDLPTYPTKPNEVTLSGFLTAEDAGLNMTDLSSVGSPTRTIVTDPAPFTGRRGGEGRNPDGFAYFVTTNAGANPSSISYAGILATTNLGAPLPSTTANAVWAGHFSTATATNIAINYYVDFTNGRFGFSNAGGDGFGTLTHTDLNGTYTMNAHFGSHASANGYSAGRMGGTLAISSIHSALHPTITGLIGEEGVVGVFTQVGLTTSLAGGFTATNPAYTPPE